MTKAGDEIDRLLDASAALLALPVTAEQRPGVRQFLEIAREMAAALDAVELDGNELQLAPVYRPPRQTASEGPV